MQTGKRGRPAGMSVEELHAAVLAEIRRLSIRGVAPSPKAYNRGRNAGFTTAQNAVARLGRGWPTLAREAGLLPASGTMQTSYPRSKRE